MRPLAGVRVLDFGQYLAGPLVGMMLADMGAEVIRIDPPGGPRMKSPAADMLSRGKLALTLDLKNTDDLHMARDLAARSDILIENFRPGVMDRLGLGADALRAEHPGLIYLSLPGFASTDPTLSDVPAWEAVIAARTGQFTDMGLNRRLMGINPSFTPLALASAYGACFGAMSVLFALAAKRGDRIEVPLASALLEGLVYNCEQIEDYPARYKSPREVELERRAAAGEAMSLSFPELEEFLDPFYRTYKCADGRGFYVVACSVKDHGVRALRALGLNDLAESLPDFDGFMDRADWPADWSLRNYPVGDADRGRVSKAMKAAFEMRPSHEWEEIFGAAKAPATAQRSSADWLADPHALASGLILQVEDPEHGTMHQMGNVAWLAGDACVNKTPVQHDPDLIDAILREPPRPAPMTDTGGWLDGIRVLDLTNVIAGPTIGSTLARFGAEVTLVQPVAPTVDPWNAVVFGLHAHRGKESVLLDLSRPDGRAAFERLLLDADVVTMNGTDQQRDALGLSPEKLTAVNSRLILVQLDAFGGPLRGPKSDHLGYDDLAQAATGVMTRFGGGMETPEEHAHFGTIDVLTGHAACVALGAALHRLNTTGKGGIARASLAGAGNLIQAPFMYDFDGRAPFDEPAGRDARGWGPFYHCYKASDGWFFLAAPSQQDWVLERLGVDAKGMTDLFKQHPIAHWQSMLAKGAVAVMPLGSLLDTRDQAMQMESAGAIDLTRDTFRVIRHDQHPMGRWVDLVAPNAARPQEAQITIPGPAPKYGEDTRCVLARAGFSEQDITNMIETGAASESWSARYLPE